MQNKDIHLWGVKQNNLKNLDVKFPLGKMTVICGPSGSGKSSLAFDVLFAEGQRRFIESMSNYARQFLNKAPKPDIEGVQNIPPAISIEQKNSVKNSRSTVGTTTELIDYFRLLFEKIGVPYCPTHKIACTRQSVVEATDSVLKNFSGDRGYILVEIGKKSRIAEGKKLHSQLLQDGYLRILPKVGGSLVEISEPAAVKKGLPKDNFFLVIDRLQFSEDDKGRLTDSMTQAYDASQKYNVGLITRRCKVLTVAGKVLDFSEENSCPECDYVAPHITSRLFSFNSPVGACPTCKGFGNILSLDEKKVVPNPRLTLAEGALHPFTMPSASSDLKHLKAFCKKSGISMNTPWEDLSDEERKVLWEGTENFWGVKGLFEYLEEIKYKMHVRVFIARYRSPSECSECKGSRLRKETDFILIDGMNIHGYCRMTIHDLAKRMAAVELTKSQQQASGEVMKQIRSRLDFLLRVGVPYLTLMRETRTLSGGEYQRLILANQLGMGLSQTLYVLDEPTVGLHPRDNDRLISVLHNLRDLGNTVVIVEHDKDVIASAENIVEMGPGSGQLGGEIVYSGFSDKFLKISRPDYLLQHTIANRPVDIKTHKFILEMRGARGHNLKNLNVKIPLHRLVAVTGVSGSGKSTLVTKTLYPALARALNIEFVQGQDLEDLRGFDELNNVLLIDQSSIGKSARSSPITYMKSFDAIRTLMSQLPESKVRGYTPGTFSLNVDGGRCPSCRGTGFEEIDMQFMDNVIIPCEVCDSKKYRAEILEIKYKDKNIHDILQLTVAEALNFFVAYPQIRRSLKYLQEVGLEYLQIGQPAGTLSGGESQRLKIARELTQVASKGTLYILDEPTTGLHFREVKLLLTVLQKLIESGGSVLVVEHNLDVIGSADYIIDLGPEAGEKGGELVVAGAPNEIVKSRNSLTGAYLKKYLERRS